MEVNVQLTDGFVLLRPYVSEDTPRLHEAAMESQPQIQAWMGWCPPDYAIETSRAWVADRPEKWAQGAAYEFAITDPRDGTYLGGCGLNGINTGARFCNLGYWVRTSRTKKGVATAATRLLARFAFAELKLQRLEIVVATANLASQRVATKAGATREGVLRNRYPTTQGPAQDAVMFSLIPEDLAIKS